MRGVEDCGGRGCWELWIGKGRYNDELSVVMEWMKMCYDHVASKYYHYDWNLDRMLNTS